jgi:hypothetical protein
MYARPLALVTLAGALSLALVSSGCEGDSGGMVTDASSERPLSTGGSGGFGGGAGTGGRGGGAGQTGDTRLAPDTPPPVPNPASAKILPGQTDLLGSFQTGCTFGPGGERWCAVSRPLSLARRELWFVNVTKAGTAKTLVSTCDQAGLCIKATDNVYTARPEGGPAYPEDAARASGNSFIYLADPISQPADAFQGDVWVHTVGSPTTTKIGDNVFDCAVAGQRFIDQGRRQINKVVGICAGDPSSAEGEEPNFFTLKGGPILGQDVPASPAAPPLTKMETGSLLPDLQKIYPVHPGTQALRWRVGFSPDGEQVILSAGGATLAETEKLSIIDIDDIGKTMPTPVMNGDNVTRWTLSASASKIFYFKEYNYNAMGNQSGTLTMADFPSGANVKELKGMRVPSGNMNGIGAYRILVNAAGMDAGVGFLSGLAMGRGNYSIIKDPINGSMDDMNNVVSVVQSTRSLPLPSPDLRFSLFAREFSMDNPTSDLWVIGNNATMDCSLTTSTLGGIFGFPFTQSGGIVFWADNYDAATLSAEGWLSDPSDCRNPSKKKMWSRNVDFWFVDADRMVLYSDESNGAQVTLKYAFVNGNTLGAPTTIQTRADRFFHIVLDAQPGNGQPPRFKGIVYTLTGGSDEVNGVYYYELPAAPGGQPVTDAGTGG